MIRQWIIEAGRRLAHAVVWRLAKDVELMQVISAGISTAAFTNGELSKATVVRDRDGLLLKALERVQSDGIVCEFGVYKGRTLRIIANALQNRLVYGFDSFDGLPEVWRAGFDKGKFKVGVDHIPSFPANVKIYAGLFNVTLPKMLQDDLRPAAFLHVDCDLYSSTKCVFDALSSRLVVGTVIVFDEYFNFPGWEHDEHRALIEASRDFGFGFEYIFYNPDGQQVAIILTEVRNS